MAKRFGGEFSPDGRSQPGAKPSPLASAKPSRHRLRLLILFLLPLPLLFLGLGKPPLAMAVDFTAAATLIFAAWLLQEGLKAENAFNDRKIARRPAFPRKICASVLTGIGIALATMDGLSGIPGAALYGIVGGILHSFSFGIDPLRDKGMEGIDTFQTERVATALDKAEGYLAEMKDAALRAGDRGVMARVDRFQTTARVMFRTVEEDPRDLSAARKFLGIYLVAARDATVKFADLFAQTRDAQTLADYDALLTDLEASFEAKREKLLVADRSDLDIEIEVLRDRLKRDGLLIND
ncbi:5-bromo-4-chloroindolyl phosphate hydrolysis family protein [Thalassobacter stenotrophicus]|uniref:5-bromo-4-chloroindolyl phosphate hydrolysis protein n=2 Tax=Thalassobacter stenotrophicus TaxID=266809 RepID=A0A0P1EYX7_9RHOB|nr:5-bromo-4-chloroindolyl phosphate hydrolysis family protein [Thalassobacter stenotrophicus]PVZ47530.1 hypothetical protein DD557_01480 [Thalassobacter stenotrophicus]CUH60318.1 5-bromo-4-chloroindolyl phosphate hydrolysis protein [Thalassobacter stenotrophicus]SHI72620.1 5-bromo-4-chloroindolyl phosphate hydrolysis protein [Thalassobacter stenotrophicus DSM 16310]